MTRVRIHECELFSWCCRPRYIHKCSTPGSEIYINAHGIFLATFPVTLHSICHSFMHPLNLLCIPDCSFNFWNSQSPSQDPHYPWIYGYFRFQPFLRHTLATLQQRCPRLPAWCGARVRPRWERVRWLSCGGLLSTISRRVRRRYRWGNYRDQWPGVRWPMGKAWPWLAGEITSHQVTALPLQNRYQLYYKWSINPKEENVG